MLTLDKLKQTVEYLRRNKPPDVWYALDIHVRPGTCVICRRKSRFVPEKYFVLNPIDFYAIPDNRRGLIKHISEWKHERETCGTKHPRHDFRCDLKKGHDGPHQCGGIDNYLEWENKAS
jgi:hypothetical protein